MATVEREEYERMAAVADRHWWYVATRQLLQSVVEPLLPAVHGGTRYLDAGGGTGNTGRWLAARAPTVLADLSPDALAVGPQVAPGYLGVRADLRRLPHPDAAFDAVLCVTVLYHEWVDDPSAVVAELSRVTRPGGLIALMEPGVRRLVRGHDRVTQNARRFSVGDLRRLAAGAGLEVLRATGAYSFLVPPAAVLAVLERGKSTSDVGRNEGGLGGAFPLAARAERALLRRVDLPAGLSVLAVARRPS
jgi:SAM-dependent methyltransferase